ncbi:MAG: B12-binding domain-containing radical SAM protein [Nitrosomonadaceae bacterium]|nr:B12-binding domain-containing radical SAM protein [Nitrosomonadaceae bacterium]|tara:strand:- start:43361 stop:44953 length:1593 start_codon:yes stop_codon:yes gene_type:complete
MSKVLIINPTVREEDVPRHVPYGLALLTAIAIEKKHMVQVYDDNAWRQDEDTLVEVLRADDWEVVALGGITTAYGSIKKIVKVVNEVLPNCLIVLGGGVLTSLPREIMTYLPQVSIGCIGEGFSTFPEILESVDNGNRNWEKIKGVIFRGQDGELIFTEERPILMELDSLPYPAWDMFPLEEVYFKNSEALFSEQGMLAKRRLDINASYGCSLICRYCYHLGLSGDIKYEEDDTGKTTVEFDKPGNYTRVIRYHSPEYIVNMVKHVYDKYQVDFIGFLDENLMTMNTSSGGTWLGEICELWKKKGLAPKSKYDDNGKLLGWEGVYWGGTSHATLCNPEILKVMKEAGCSHLVYGYESFSPHVMRTIGKGATPKNNFQSFFWTLEANIRPIPNLIIGFPVEDFQSLRDNIQAWDELGIVVKPHFATPYPGSEWFSTYRKTIEAQYDGDLEAFILDLGDATQISATISHNFNAVELIGLREMMLARNFRAMDQYEKTWRKNHNIPEGQPSTLIGLKKDKKNKLSNLKVFSNK